MASPRRLSYKDSSVWHLEEVIAARFADCDGLTDRYIFPDMTTQVPLVLYLSQEEFTQLYSAVLTGADLSYPDMSHTIEYLFLQTVICAMNELCQAIADCIESSQATQLALQVFLAGANLTGGVGDPWAPLAEEITGENLLPPGYICTDDKAFGMALAVVNSIHEATVEVLQAIEILTNPLEITAELGDNIPGVGALASASDIANWIQDSAAEGYDLAWSDVVRDELACLLWCDFKGGCSLTYDSIWNTYLGAADVSPPGGVLLTDWLAWLIALPFVASLSTVSTISLLGLLAMRYGGSFGDFQLGIRSIETVIALAQDDSSSDWAIVCDPCEATWCYQWDFAGDAQGFATASTPPFGVITGSGWNATDGILGSPRRAIDVERTSITELPDITSIQIDIDLVRGTFDPTTENIFFLLLNGGNVLVFQADDPRWVNGSLTITYTGDFADVNAVRIAMNSSFDSYGGSVLMKAMRLYGNGVNPFGVDNCP